MTRAERAAIADYERDNAVRDWSALSGDQQDAWLAGRDAAVARAGATAPPPPAGTPRLSASPTPVDLARAAATAEARQVVELCIAVDRPDLMASCIGLTVDQAQHAIAMAGWDRAFAQAHARTAAETGATVERTQQPDAGATASGWDNAFDRVHGRG